MFVEGAFEKAPRRQKHALFVGVSDSAVADAAAVLSSKHGRKVEDGGQCLRTSPKRLGPEFSLCCRNGCRLVQIALQGIAIPIYVVQVSQGIALYPPNWSYQCSWYSEAPKVPKKKHASEHQLFGKS